MSNFTLCYDNQADAATLTGGSWSATLSRDNLKDYRLRKKARSTNALAASTVVRFALPAATYIEALGLIATNATVDATYRFRLFSDSGFTTVTRDSTTLSLFPAGSMPDSQIPAGAPNAGTGKPTAAEAARFQVNIVHLLDEPLHAQYGELQVTDTTNPAGYFEAGRLFIGRKFQAEDNPEYGKAALELTSRTSVIRAKDGTPYFDVERPDFCIPFALDWLSEHEAMKALDLQALVDVHGEVLAMWDPEEVAYWWRRQVFGRLATLNPIQHPMYATYATAFQVEGTL